MLLGKAKTEPERPPRPWAGAARSLARRLACLAGAALLVLLCAAPSPGAMLSLNLVETDTGRVAMSLPIKPGEEFTVWFLHSYDRAFFAEHYQALAPGRILLTHMTFKSNLNGEGFEYHDFHLRPDGVGELRNINEPRGEVHFMVGSPDMANHTLIFRGKRIPLLNYVAPRTLVSFRIGQAARQDKD
ncbi:MAG: DUF1850 domain-containing protein [Desulfarculaceae bacterium]|nr:DUF1850 domain-containing protein [Desulfarculaceae bacterium]